MRLARHVRGQRRFVGALIRPRLRYLICSGFSKKKVRSFPAFKIFGMTIFFYMQLTNCKSFRNCQAVSGSNLQCLRHHASGLHSCLTECTNAFFTSYYREMWIVFSICNRCEMHFYWKVCCCVTSVPLGRFESLSLPFPFAPHLRRRLTISKNVVRKRVR